MKIRIFISSVQSEFTEERKMLAEYLMSDPLLGKFFEPFVFENTPAMDSNARQVYLQEVEKCNIYLGLLGEKYGNEDKEGISPTEREYDYATLLHKYRLIFIKRTSTNSIDSKEIDFIQKVGSAIVRRTFSTPIELRSAVYAALVRYLEEKEILRMLPFDASLNSFAKLEDIDEEKVRNFVISARNKRALSLPIDTPYIKVLTHLNLISDGKLTNASLLLFGTNPQRFFLSSEIKCAHFYGYTITKPIPAYQVYKGDVFQLVNQAVEFLFSRIDATVGTRDKSIQADTAYELPLAAVTEAIVNAVAHRDYTSNGSIQVMLFKDRLEIWNPGCLPIGLTPAKLREPHSSIPGNPLIAEAMYLNGYVERMGTGTGDIIDKCVALGLKTPEFIQEEDFKTIIWRPLKNNYVGDNVGDNVGDASLEQRGEKICHFMLSNKKISAKQMAELLKVSVKTIERDIDKLKKENKIKRIGNERSGYWEVLA